MRASNPTTRQLELTLAALQGRDDCLATASGVNAIAQTLIALTKQGDHILCFVETYGPTRNIIRRLLARFGVEHTMLSIEDLAGIENVLATRPTRLVIFESPTNPITKVADIERLVDARASSRRARGHGQHLRGLSPARRIRHRPLRAQPHQVRLGCRATSWVAR